MRCQYINILKFRRPAKLVGKEINLKTKEYDSKKLNVLLAYPDDYEIGMSSYGYQLLFHSLNKSDKIVVHRGFLPPPEVIKYLKDNKIPLYSIDSSLPVKEYDILAFSVHYELCYTNILAFLELSEIPILRRDRKANGPLVIAGGPAVTNPLPLSEFIDAFFIGEWDRGLREILEEISLKNLKQKNEILHFLSENPYIYVPEYTKGKVKRRVEELSEYIEEPLLPLIEIPHNRITVEISRGCKRGCRFCQAGFVYRPLRERSRKEIFRIIEMNLKATGFENVSLLSLSATDYTNIEDTILELAEKLKDSYTSLSLPSLRADTLTEKIIEAVKKVRKTGFTIAPEAGTERLRKVINKDFSDNEILETIEKVVKAGWLTIKLYFMIGLPTEQAEDVEGILKLIKEIKKVTIKSKRPVKINVTISPFIPKPHTPFQWESMREIKYLEETIKYIKKNVPKGVEIKNHEPKKSLIEGIISCGDSSTSELLVKAFLNGAIFDEWDEYFNWKAWEKALETYQIPKMTTGEPPPWSFIDTLIDTNFLLTERERALKEITTPMCHRNCNACGVCSKEAKLTISEKSYEPIRLKLPTFSSKKATRYIGAIARFGRFTLIGQNDFENLFHRILRKCEVPLTYSEGFNPRPYIYFLEALPLGVIGLEEPFEIVLSEEIDPDELRNIRLPIGITIKWIKKINPNQPKLSKLKYRKSYTAVIDTSKVKVKEEFFENVQVVNRGNYIIASWETQQNPYKFLSELVKEGDVRDIYIVRRILLWEELE